MGILIREIDRRKNVTYIRVGKDEYEIPPGDEALAEWINRRATLSQETVAAMALLEPLQADPTLKDVSAILNIPLDVAITQADVVVPLPEPLITPVPEPVSIDLTLQAEK